MAPFNKFIAAAGTAAILAGCAGEAGIALPSDLAAATETIPLSGMAAADRGSFRVGAAQGHFRRGNIEETEDGGRLVRQLGGGRFEIIGAEFDGGLGGACDYRRSELNTDAITAPVQRFAYRCSFERNGRPAEAGLILEAVPATPGKRLSGITRAGKVHMGGAVLTIRAIHDFQGGRVPSGTPLGYMFDLDGRRVGAVDLNRSPKAIHLPRAGAERQAVLAASVALALLQDPGE